MEDIRLPGFTAEASLAKSNKAYSYSLNNLRMSENLVLPYASKIGGISAIRKAIEMPPAPDEPTPAGYKSFGEYAANYYGFDTTYGEGRYCMHLYDAWMTDMLSQESNTSWDLYLEGLVVRDCRYGT